MRGVYRFGALAVLTAVLAALLIVPHVAHAATIVVDTLDDENDGSCSDGDCSLRDAVQVANPGDTVTFGVRGTITLSGNEIVINKNLTIAGPGAGSLAVSGNNASRVFNISAGSVSISGLTIRNGRAEYGGGIFNQATLTLANSVVSANTANHDPMRGGGGILSDGPLTVTNSLISGNTSINGAGIYSARGNAVVTSSTISGNYASGFGGGVVNLGWMLTVTCSTIGGNYASTHGGGIFQGYADITNTTITHSSIERNVTAGSDWDISIIPGALGSLAANDNWWGAATGPNTPGADTTNASVTSFLTAKASGCGSLQDGPPDDRINWKHGDTYAIVYPRQDEKGKPDLHFYCVDLWGNGTLGLIVTQEMIDKAPKTPSKNTEIASTNQCRVPVKLFVLTTGEYQANIGPDIEGKVDVVIFTGLPPAHVYYKHFNIYDLFR